MQIKTTVRYPLTPIRMDTIQERKTENNSVDKNVDKLYPFSSLWE